MENEALAYEAVLWFGVVALLFGGGGMMLSALLRRNKPYEAKLSAYESGEQAEGGAQGKFHPRFYTVGLIFLLFEAELLFLFPWTLVYAQPQANAATGGAWAWFCLVEITLFLFLLVLGFVYALKKGHLDWDKSEHKIPKYHSPVPEHLYTQVNNRYQTDTIKREQ